jgi:prevent-host-death family protein
MKKTAITVTEAARNFSHCINRVHYQKRSFVLVKNGRPLARIVPESEKVCTGGELAEALAHVELPAAEALAWSKDLVKARKSLKNPEDKWR